MLEFNAHVERFPTYWSYSSWSTWNQCAYKWYRCRIMGDREPSSPALDRGNMVHALAESFLKGNIKGALPFYLKKLSGHYKKLLTHKPVVEEFWHVDKNWKPTDDKNKWCTMKMDAAVKPSIKIDNRLFIQDLKTGREYATHESQGSLYACIGAALYPDVKIIEVEFWYADSGEVSRVEYTRRQIQALTDYWIDQGQRMLKPQKKEKYLPTPSADACRWCFLRSDKGGPCKEWKTVRGI